MANGMLINPATVLFEYRSMDFRSKKQDKMIGFGCSLLAHAVLLVLGGIALIQPIEFGVDTGLSGMEVQLIAGGAETVEAPQDVVKEDPPLPPKEPPVIQETIPEPSKEIEKIVPPEPVKNIGNSDINASSIDQGALTEAQPAYLTNPAPRYPLDARRRGWEGTVILRISVDRAGAPTSVVIKESSGHGVLDEAAIKTVNKWQFRPAQMGSIPVESSVEVPIRFELKDLTGR